jgi:hypothetical protein
MPCLMRGKCVIICTFCSRYCVTGIKLLEKSGFSRSLKHFPKQYSVTMSSPKHPKALRRLRGFLSWQ